jgi:hypothetical protein
MILWGQEWTGKSLREWKSTNFSNTDTLELTNMVLIEKGPAMRGEMCSSAQITVKHEQIHNLQISMPDNWHWAPCHILGYCCQKINPAPFWRQMPMHCPAVGGGKWCSSIENI